jgi:hypothetical protein
MVNKGSFFSRLKERWTSGSGVRVERNGGRLRASERAERANVERVDGRSEEGARCKKRSPFPAR